MLQDTPLEDRCKDQLVVCFVDRHDQILGYVSTNKLYARSLDNAALVDAASTSCGHCIKELLRAAQVLLAHPSPIAKRTKGVHAVVLERWSTAVCTGNYIHEIKKQLGL